MANGYIGKISAVVTANTSDLSRKLQGAVKDVDRFANTLNRSVAASAQQATSSLEKIFTPLQRLERKLQTALQLNLRTDNEVRKIQQLVSVADGINKPLERAAGSFSKLSLEVQGAFLPALNRAQGAAVNLANTLQQQGSVSASSFKQVESAVDQAAKAIQRLSQAQQLASQGFTGNELQFGNPRLFETLSASAKTTQRAAALPASALVDGDIARQVRALEQYQAAALEADARVSALRLDPNVNPAILISAERQLESLVETYSRASAQLSRAIQVRFDVQDAETRINRLRGIADAALRGIPASVDAIDAEFADLAARIERLGLEDRGRLDPLIQEFIDSAKAADPLIAQFEKVLRLRRELDGIESQPDRIARANELLAIDTAESDRLSRESGLERSAGASTRLVDRIGPSVTALRGQLATLAEPLRASVGPEVDKIENKFRLLARSGVAATGEEIQRLKADIASLNTAISSRQGIGKDFLKSFGGAGAAGISLGVDEKSLRAVGSQIEFVQTRLSRLGQEARGPVVAALENLRAAASRLFQSGGLDTKEGRAELEALRMEIIRVAAAAEGVSLKKFGELLKRAGDIGRGAFGNVGLAVQQAIFAFDDFFSVTGGLDQRIRAAGNNISQLGFLLGGTAGLVAGVLVSALSQGAVALVKFANGGASSEDQTKALNEALARQKSLVQDLAQAFESLSESITRGIFSESGQQARELSASLDEIRKKQKEIRDGAVGDADPRVRRERAIQGSLQRQLEGDTNVGRRVALQGLIDESRVREREASREAVRRAPPSAQDVESGLRRTVFLSGTRGPSPADRREFAQIRDSVAAANNDPRKLIDLLTKARDEQGALALQNSFNQVRATGARGNVAALDELIKGLERQIAEGLDARAADLFESLDGQASVLRQAQDKVAKAIEAGVPAAEAIAESLDAAGRELEAAEKAIVDRLKSGLPVDEQLISTAEKQRDAAIEAIKSQEDNAAAMDSARRSVESFSTVLDRVGPQLANTVVQESRSVADQARRDDNAAQARFDVSLRRPAEQRVLAKEDAEFAQRQRQRSDLERQELESQAVAVKNKAVIERARFDRDVSGLAGVGLKAYELGQQRDAIRREIAAGNLDDEQKRQAIARTDAIDKDLKREFDDFAATESGKRQNLSFDDFMKRIVGRGGVDVEALKLMQERDEVDALLRGDISPMQRQDATERRNQISRQLDQKFEDSDGGRSVAALGDLIDKRAAAFAQEREDILRGRELSKSPAEQAGRKLADDLRALEAARDEAVAGGGNRLLLNEEFAKDRQRIIEDSFRSTAPATFALADSVANAVLQGPSRASLEASDVSTVEGARELNRLLRGDDASRDQNLVELQKQSQSLDELVRIAREGGAVIAN